MVFSMNIIVKLKSQDYYDIYLKLSYYLIILYKKNYCAIFVDNCSFFM